MTRSKKGKGLSGYVRHGKREFLYSTVLRNWQEAVKKGDSDGASELAERHARLFGYRLNPNNGV
jgi:hypothetical protein